MASNFALDLTNFNARTMSKIDKVVRKVVLEIGIKVVMRSPVGDPDYWSYPAPPGYVGGRFRGNWQHGLGTMPSGQLDTIDPSGNASIARLRQGTSTAGTGLTNVHYIVNNLPYSERLEHGWSRQAPDGIVDLTLVEFPGIVRASAAEANR